MRSGQKKSGEGRVGPCSPFDTFRIGGSDSSSRSERRLPALISVAPYLLPILKRPLRRMSREEAPTKIVRSP
jgi:hypothetical protein